MQARLLICFWLVTILVGTLRAGPTFREFKHELSGHIGVNYSSSITTYQPEWFNGKRLFFEFSPNYSVRLYRGLRMDLGISYSFEKYTGSIGRQISTTEHFIGFLPAFNYIFLNRSRASPYFGVGPELVLGYRKPDPLDTFYRKIGYMNYNLEAGGEFFIASTTTVKIFLRFRKNFPFSPDEISQLFFGTGFGHYFF